MRKRILCLLAVLAMTAGLLAGCQPGVDAREPEDGGKIHVVSTIFPPYDFVRQVAGEKVELTMLLSPGAESHSYDPTPQDIITIQNCDLFLYVGGDSDTWVERILDSMDRERMTVLALMDLVETVEEEIVEGMEHGHDHDGDEDHDHHDGEDHDYSRDEDDRELDEHVWTSPVNAQAIVRAISSALSALDPDNAAAYGDNAAGYLAELAALDEAYRAVTAEAARTTVIFGDRFPFRYLADAYGLDYYAAFPGCSTKTEASAATVAFLIDKTRDEEIPVVFHIELSNGKMADTICEGSGAKKLLLHSCHNVSRDDFAGGATYLSLMEQNLEHLKEALS